MHRFLVLLLPLALGACAPTAVTVVSLAAGGFSYATTGKGLTDHAISGVTQSDCAVHRVLSDRPLCAPEQAPMIAAPPSESPVFVAGGP